MPVLINLNRDQFPSRFTEGPRYPDSRVTGGSTYLKSILIMVFYYKIKECPTVLYGNIQIMPLSFMAFKKSFYFLIERWIIPESLRMTERYKK
jgi:hypothetical protein